ncbi:hypothetical protein LRP30_25110 [Bradyrhizobium sp. C-145]|uniref:hypothetical protein n=1 Tax=Bradyrhizobium sp. C-145 TaxID=574727 RepID=UPI00201B6E15|nr:hypothetical protein [Bradyrhizobium sp. C-145]UQR60290.1 hypothetical protein LRP30_25110 [Bradyrhizobium sp. C-145]
MKPGSSRKIVRADFAMVSRLDATAGATSYNPDEAEIARAMFAHARKRVILADYSKLGVVSRVSYCALVDADCVIVDVRARQNAMFPQLCSVNPDVVVA